jgi:hypothetical protein
VSLKSLFTLTSVCLLMGCESLGTPSEARSPIPPSLTSQCDPLPDLEDGTAATVLRWIVGASEAFHACDRKHKALVEAVR